MTHFSQMIIWMLYSITNNVYWTWAQGVILWLLIRHCEVSCHLNDIVMVLQFSEVVCVCENRHLQETRDSSVEELRRLRIQVVQKEREIQQLKVNQWIGQINMSNIAFVPLHVLYSCIWSFTCFVCALITIYSFSQHCRHQLTFL